MSVNPASFVQDSPGHHSWLLDRHLPARLRACWIQSFVPIFSVAFVIFSNIDYGTSSLFTATGNTNNTFSINAANGLLTLNSVPNFSVQVLPVNLKYSRR